MVHNAASYILTVLYWCWKVTREGVLTMKKQSSLSLNCLDPADLPGKLWSSYFLIKISQNVIRAKEAVNLCLDALWITTWASHLNFMLHLELLIALTVFCNTPQSMLYFLCWEKSVQQIKINYPGWLSVADVQPW